MISCTGGSRAAGNRRGVATSLDNLGAVTREGAELRRAVAYWEEALARYRELGYRWAYVALAVGDSALAAECAAAALRHGAEIEHTREQARAILTRTGHPAAPRPLGELLAALRV